MTAWPENWRRCSSRPPRHPCRRIPASWRSTPAASLRRWLILHELTHAWQFEEHAWLREHLQSKLRSLMLETVSEDGSSLLPSREVMRRLPDTVRKQVHGVRHLQAVMSVLEGY